MDVDAGQILVWVIIGGLAGAFTGALVRRNRTGFGIIGNIVVGLIGALLGGFIFEVLNVPQLLPEIQFTANDLIAAVVGSLLLVALLSFVRR